MSKIQTILALLNLLKPYITDLVPIVKAIMEILKQFNKDSPLVGAVDPVTQLQAEGLTQEQAEDLLN